MTEPNLTNLVAAFALRLSDRIAAVTDELMPRSETARALAFIGRSEGETVRGLSLRLGLSHAATVRLVDRLEKDGLVARHASPTDGRAVELSLTVDGTVAFREMLARTENEIERALRPLTGAQRGVLGDCLRDILSGLETQRLTAAQGCRFCGADKCPDCPVADACS